MSPTSHSVITVDKTATRRRWEALRAYCDANVTDGRSFVCSSEARCRSSLRPNVTFHPGQLSYVGSHYDLSVDGTPLRVLIVAMDTGRPDELVTLDRRRSQVAARIPETFSQRNAHMRGTTTALRLLFGRQAGDDRSAEYLEIVDDAGEKDRVHLLDAYAMANLRLCSAIRGDTQSRASGEMSRQCLRHLTATVEVLEPTIVILQGTELRRAIDSELRETTRIAPALERTRFAHCPVRARRHPPLRPIGGQELGATHFGAVPRRRRRTDIAVCSQRRR